MSESFKGFTKPKQNWSKLPHELIESLDTFTSLAELKVVLYVLRHTWGFKDDHKKITLDEFMKGRRLSDGSRMDNGTGMTKPSIINGLKRAIEHGFIFSHQTGDAGRLVKSYALNEDGLKSLTPPVKKFTPPGKEDIPRTEKGTETGTKKDSSEPESPEPKPAKIPKRDMIFEILLYLGWGQVYEKMTETERKAIEKGRVSKIKKQLMTLEPKPDEFELRGFFKWYKNANRDTAFPRDPGKFIEHYIEYRQSLKVKKDVSKRAVSSYQKMLEDQKRIEEQNDNPE